MNYIILNPILLVYPNCVHTVLAATSLNSVVHGEYHPSYINTSNLPSDRYGPSTNLTLPSYSNAGLFSKWIRARVNKWAGLLILLCFGALSHKLD